MPAGPFGWPREGSRRKDFLRPLVEGAAMTSDIDIARAAITAGFSAIHTPTAVAIALSESQGFATSSTATHRGLWRLYLTDVGADWADPVANAKAAKRVFDRSGWGYWPSYRSGRHLLMMHRAAAAATAATAGNLPLPSLPELPNPLEPIQQLAEEARRGLSVVSDKDTWIRIGMLALGAVIVAAGVAALLLALSGKTVAGFLGSKAKAATKTIAKG